MSDINPISDVIIIGYGEVGRSFGKQIELFNKEPIYVDPLAEGMHGKRKVLGKIPKNIQKSSIVIGTFPSAVALTVARDIMSRDVEFLYVDLSSSSQSLMRDCAELFNDAQSHFIDGAIMGSVDLSGANSPIILSGPCANDTARILNNLGFSATPLPNSSAGDAGGLKLLRTLMTKGIEALAIECFATARAMNLEAEIRHNLSDIGTSPFPDLLDAMVRSHVIHAPRRQHEVEAALEQAHAMGLSAPLTQAVLEKYTKTANRIANEQPKTPMDIDQAVAWLSEELK